MRRRVTTSVILATCSVLLALPASAPAFGPLSTVGVSEGGSLSNRIYGVAVAADGSLYVADSGDSRVKVLSPQGGLVRSLGRDPVPSPGGGGSGGDGCDDANAECGGDDGTGQAGVLRSPRDVALDSAGNVFVANYSNRRIEVFSADGAFIRAFGKDVNPSGGDVCTDATQCQRGAATDAPGVVLGPTGLGADPAGTIYVAGANRRIDVFSPAGAFVRSIGKELVSSGGGGDGCEDQNDPACMGEAEAESAGAVSRPYDVAVGADGRVAVTDQRNRRVDVFAPDGSFIHAFGADVNPTGGDFCTAASECQKGAESEAAGGFRFPSAIAVTDSGNLYAADITNNRINEFTFGGSFVGAFGQGVVDGTSAFQACTLATDCVAGASGSSPGSVSGPRGLAMDCFGTLYVTEWWSSGNPEQDGGDGASFARVERFGDLGTPYPPCTTAAPGQTSAPAPPPPTAPFLVGSHQVAKPELRVELNRKRGTATLIAVVSDTGALLLRGKGVRKVKRAAKRPGEVELAVAPGKKVKRRLRRKGKATVKVFLTFNATGGSSSTQDRAIRLRMSARARRALLRRLRRRHVKHRRLQLRSAPRPFAER